jgi:hypothetical protein
VDLDTGLRKSPSDSDEYGSPNSSSVFLDTVTLTPLL